MAFLVDRTLRRVINGLRARRPVASYTAEQKERGYYGNRRNEMLPFVPSSTRILLDVGCGRGAFGATVKRTVGAKVWGIELDHSAARAAAVRLDRVIEADIHQAFVSLPAGHFDCVTLNDVLEHLPEPAGALAAAKRLLAPGGVVVASLPNVRHLPTVWDLIWNDKWEYADCGVLDRTHLRFFAKLNIRALFEDNGYQVQQLVGINASWPRLQGLATHLAPRFEDMQYLQFAVVARPLR